MPLRLPIRLALLALLASAACDPGRPAQSTACSNAPAPLDGPDWTARGSATFAPATVPDGCGNVSSGLLSLAGPLATDGKLHGGLQKSMSGLPPNAVYGVFGEVQDSQGCASAITVTADGGQGAPVVASATGNYYTTSLPTIRGNLTVTIAAVAARPCSLRISNVVIR